MKIRMYTTAGGSNTIAIFNSFDEAKEAIKQGGKSWLAKKTVFDDLRREDISIEDMRIEQLHLYRIGGKNFVSHFLETVEEA